MNINLIVIVFLLILCIYLIYRYNKPTSDPTVEKFVSSEVVAEQYYNGTLTPPNATAMVLNTPILNNTRVIYGGYYRVNKTPLTPTGMIVPYVGSAAPAGWALCDGTNGTPDLRGRFIIGTSPQYPLGTKGGEENHTLTIDEMPAHTHGVPVSGAWRKLDYGAFWPAATYHGGGGVTNNAFFPTGGGKPHNNMPPYYVLSYIMKIDTATPPPMSMVIFPNDNTTWGSTFCTSKLTGIPTRWSGATCLTNTKANIPCNAPTGGGAVICQQTV